MNKATAEFEIKVSNGRIVGQYNLSDGRYKMVIEKATQEKAIAKVEASELSTNEKFMKHNPKTKAERQFKELLEEAIKKGLRDFWRPIYDPSFYEVGTGICYQPGKKPATCRTYIWWETMAKNFLPECRSRLGTKYEYVAFLGVIIKKMVEIGWNVSEAWDMVCNDSKKLGHYWNSENAKYNLEDTGCREICGFFDFANTQKILAEDKETGGFWIAGGDYNKYSNTYPLAFIDACNRRLYHFNSAVGWIVLESPI